MHRLNKLILASLLLVGNCFGSQRNDNLEESRLLCSQFLSENSSLYQEYENYNSSLELLLFEAVMKGNNKLALDVIQKIGVNAPNVLNIPILSNAISSYNIEIIPSLFHAGVHVNEIDSCGKRALDYAYEINDKNLIIQLLEHGARPSNILSDDDFGVNKVNNDNYTPLMLATLSNDLLTIDLLLCENPDLYIRNNQNDEVIDIALQYNRIEILQKFLAYTVKYQDCSLTKKLLDSGNLDVNEKDNNGNAPLFVTIDNNDFKTFQLLLQEDYNPYLFHANGKTITSFIINRERLDMLRVLTSPESTIYEQGKRWLNHRGF